MRVGRLWRMLCFAPALGGGCAAPDELLLSPSQIKPAVQDWHAVVQGHVVIRGSETLPYSFEVTHKGNGWISIGNIDIRIYDGHHDARYFDPPLLKAVVLRRRDGALVGLELTGIEVITDEQRDDVIVDKRGVKCVCVYDLASRRFVVAHDPDGLVRARTEPSEDMPRR